MNDTTLSNNTNDPTLNFFNLPPPSQLEGGTSVQDPNLLGGIGHKKQGVFLDQQIDAGAAPPTVEQLATGAIALGAAVGNLYGALWQTKNLDANNPSLPQLAQSPDGAVQAAAQNLIDVVKGNPWLAGNALTAIWVGMVKCMDMTKEMGYVEAMIKISMEIESFNLAKGSAELIIQKGEQEFQQNILKAVITAAVGAATCVVSIYTPAMMGFAGRGAAMPAGMVVGTFEMIKAVGNSLGNLVDAFYARENAEVDAAKVIKDAVKQAIDRVVDDLSQSVKDSQQFFDQMAQKLTDLIQQLKKAFEKQS